MFPSSVLLCAAPARLRRLSTRTHFFKQKNPESRERLLSDVAELSAFLAAHSAHAHTLTRSGESWKLLGKKYKVKRKSRLASHGSCLFFAYNLTLF